MLFVVTYIYIQKRARKDKLGVLHSRKVMPNFIFCWGGLGGRSFCKTVWIVNASLLWQTDLFIFLTNKNNWTVWICAGES